MSFGKHGPTSPANRIIRVTRTQAAGRLDTGAVAAAPPAETATRIPPKVKLLAWSILALMVVAAGGLGFYHAMAPSVRTGTTGAVGYGLSPAPFAVLQSDRASPWSYAGCRLDSGAFVSRDDYRLAFNAIGNMEPEETPVALRASAAFLACVVRKATETCDTEIRDRLAVDVATFFKRHGRTKRLVERMATPGAQNGMNGGTLRTFPGLRSVIQDKQAEAHASLSASDSKVGYALQTMVETGYVTPSHFGWFWKPEAITRHLEGIKPGTSTCR
jgi:hypothetical protein